MKDKWYQVQLHTPISLEYDIPDCNSSDTEAFFIVDVIDDIDYIRKFAKTYLDYGVRKFNFLGAKAQLWENMFDDVDIERHPDGEYADGIALTAVLQKREDLEDWIMCSEARNILVFYDVDGALD